MTKLTLERLRREAETFTEEIARETFLAHAGHKPVAELSPIYDRHAAVLGSDALDLTLDLFRSSAKGTAVHRSARYLLEFELEAQASRELAAIDEAEIAFENSAFVETSDGRQIQYQTATIEIANEPDRARRLALDDARVAVVEREHAPLRLKRLRREKEIIESLEIAPTYNKAFEEITGVSLERMAADCKGFLAETEAMWNDTLPYFLSRSLGIRPSEARR